MTCNSLLEGTTKIATTKLTTTSTISTPRPTLQTTPTTLSTRATTTKPSTTKTESMNKLYFHFVASKLLESTSAIMSYFLEN